MAECPKCHRGMAATATTHSCGWGQGSTDSSVVPCAHEGCQDRAIVRIKTKGWSNLCKAHYLSHHNQRAQEWCNEKGLYTHEAQVKFCSPILHNIFRHRKNGMVEF